MKFLPNLTPSQKRFITLFASVFQIKDAHGNLKPFEPLPFQQSFLKDSLLCNKNYQHRICNKGRGVGMTAVIAGEIVLAAQTMKGIKIPVTSISARTSNVLLEWCIFLCDNSLPINLYESNKKIDFDFKIERDTTINSVCKLKNNSTIIPISGGSPESVRSIRAPILILDEFAFNPEQKAILGAGERTLSEKGQITIISTPKTSDILNDEYWRIWMHAESMGYKKYFFPIFPKDSINVNKSLLEQDLPPIIAPWIDLSQLESDRSRDILMFCRENLGEVQDESVAFLSWDIIRKSCILREFQKPLPDALIRIGGDIGRTQDLTAIEGFQEIDGKYYHVFEKIMRGIDIPTQIHEIQILDEKYNAHSINIDKTGIGLGLYEVLRKEIGGKVKGIQFTKDTKQKMAVNFRNLMQDDLVYLIKEDHFMDVIHSVPYDTLNSAHTIEGHCYDNITEVLTNNGWKLFKDVTYDDKIATLNKEKDELEYQNPTNIIEQEYVGNMVHIENKQIDLNVTPNHKLYIRYPYKNTFEEIFAYQLIDDNRRIEFKKDCKWVGKDISILNIANEDIETEIFMRFFGLFISEGFTSTNNRIGICQKNIKIDEYINMFIHKLPWGFHSEGHRYDNQDSYRTKRKDLWLYLKNFGKSYEKYIPNDIKELDSKYLKILLESLIYGDGSVGKTNLSYFSSSKRLCDDIQEILLKVGWSGSIKEVDFSNHIGHKNKRPLYRININRYRQTPQINKRKKSVFVDYYNDMVYCVTVPNGIIYVRRNGKCCWSGNSDQFWACALALMKPSGRVLDASRMLDSYI